MVATTYCICFLGTTYDLMLIYIYFYPVMSFIIIRK